MRGREEGNGAIDRQALLARLGGNQGLLQELAEMLREDAPKALEEIREAIRRGDADGVKLTAHRLCSSIGSFGISPAFTVARKVEALGEAGDLAGARECCASLERALSEL